MVYDDDTEPRPHYSLEGPRGPADLMDLPPEIAELARKPGSGWGPERVAAWRRHDQT